LLRNARKTKYKIVRRTNLIVIRVGTNGFEHAKVECNEQIFKIKRDKKILSNLYRKLSLKNKTKKGRKARFIYSYHHRRL
jgi:hypothetical protein